HGWLPPPARRPQRRSPHHPAIASSSCGSGSGAPRNAPPTRRWSGRPLLPPPPLRLERRAVLLPCPLHVLFPRYPRFLGAGLYLSHLSQFPGPAHLMRRLGLAAIYQRPNTSKPAEAHKIYPYLLRGLAIERVNQVWCSDVTYIPMARGFVYLVVIMDWVSRAVLAWRLSNTLDADFC